MLVTVGFSSPWMRLLLGGGGGYFLMPNFVCKHKEMNMTQLNILERHGFFIVLLLYYTMPCSLLVCSSVIFSQIFTQCFKAFCDGNFVYAWNFYPFNLNPNSFKCAALDCPVTLALTLI